MRSKVNAVLAAVRDEETVQAERRKAMGLEPLAWYAPDELAHMVRELAALVHDVAPGAWAREASTVEALRMMMLNKAIGHPGSFAPLRWSHAPEHSIVCYWVVEALPVRWEDEAGCYAIVRPTWDHEGIVRDLLFALRVLAKLAWLRVETAEAPA